MAGWEERFDDYVERLGDTLGHADRRAPLRAYTTGLLLPGERKSVEPMAARVDPGRVDPRRHRFDALALARQQQARAVGPQRRAPVGVAQHVAQPLDVVPEPLLPARHRRPRPLRHRVVPDIGLSF